jgi:hypothetical protein
MQGTSQLPLDLGRNRFKINPVRRPSRQKKSRSARHQLISIAGSDERSFPGEIKPPHRPEALFLGLLESPQFRFLFFKRMRRRDGLGAQPGPGNRGQNEEKKKDGDAAEIIDPDRPAGRLDRLLLLVSPPPIVPPRHAKK